MLINVDGMVVVGRGTQDGDKGDHYPASQLRDTRTAARTGDGKITSACTDRRLAAIWANRTDRCSVAACHAMIGRMVLSNPWYAAKNGQRTVGSVTIGTLQDCTAGSFSTLIAAPAFAPKLAGRRPAPPPL